MALSQNRHPPKEISEDRLFDLLSAGRRRELLRYLDCEGGAATLSEATEAVAIGEGMEAGASSGTYKPIYVSLYQTHIPRLIDARAVDFETDTYVISLTPLADSLLSYLKLGAGEQQQSFFKKFLRSHSGKRDTSIS